MLFLILLPSAEARVCIVVPGSWSPRRSTCLRSANLYWCARIETTIVSSSYVSQQFCIGVPLLRLQSYHHQYTSHNHTTILDGRSLWALGFRVPGLQCRGWCLGCRASGFGCLMQPVDDTPVEFLPELMEFHVGLRKSSPHHSPACTGCAPFRAHKSRPHHSPACTGCAAFRAHKSRTHHSPACTCVCLC